MFEQSYQKLAEQPKIIEATLVLCQPQLRFYFRKNLPKPQIPRHKKA